MSTTPKARKFRIRRSGSLASDLRAVAPGSLPEQTPQDRAGAAAAAPAARQPKPHPVERLFDNEGEDGFGDRPFPTAQRTQPAADTAPRPEKQAEASAAQARSGELSEPAEVRAENTIAEIRREGLTGRQLRMARRVAQKHGLTPISDFDAVRLLREKGIDPFNRSNMLELVVPGRTSVVPDPKYGVPQTVPRTKLPATEPPSEDARAREIIRMQRDIVLRRRRRLLQLGGRLAAFVLLPTLLAGYYFFAVATPMYATKSEFVIQQAQPSMGGAATGLSSMFSGTSFATAQDSIAVQGYLQSIDAMLRLDEDMGFRAHFGDPSIDALQRLDGDATKDQAYKIFKKNVKISYDPTEGIIKMEVVAADPLVSEQFSKKLISYAEEQVDNLTQRLRADQMEGAKESYDEAERKMYEAQARILELQERLGVLDPMTESTALMSQITTFETQLQEKRLQLQQLLDNRRPNQARVDGVRGDIGRLESLIGELRSQLTDSGTVNGSLARTTGQLRLAETDLQTRQMLMTQALQQMETARIEANRQTRYLSMAVSPIAPDEPTYPRAFENTLLAFLIFGGIYLMFSLTASILREQVSS